MALRGDARQVLPFPHRPLHLRPRRGETIEVAPGTIAFFPAGWSGRCTVHETVRKVYMVR
ncbi:MAG TPA: cupin domain-containing protein [Geminicoccaceae bacterium]|nr:cupin domain-containing protein [Geminicoccaceae bacterium]